MTPNDNQNQGGDADKKTTVEEKPGEKRTVEETRTPGTPEKIERKETVDHPPQK